MPAKRRGGEKKMQQQQNSKRSEQDRKLAREEVEPSCRITREDYALLEKDHWAHYDFEAESRYMQIPQPAKELERTFWLIEQSFVMTDEELLLLSRGQRPDHVQAAARGSDDLSDANPDDDEDLEGDDDEQQTAAAASTDVGDKGAPTKDDGGEGVSKANKGDKARRHFFFRPSLDFVCSRGLRVLVTLAIFYFFTKGMFEWQDYLFYVISSVVANYIGECICRY